MFKMETIFFTRGRREETRSGTEKKVFTSCKAVTLRGGQRVTGVFSTLNILIEARRELERKSHASLFFLHIVFVI